jgi:hypothetical protein
LGLSVENSYIVIVLILHQLTGNRKNYGEGIWSFVSYSSLAYGFVDTASLLLAKTFYVGLATLL